MLRVIGVLTTMVVVLAGCSAKSTDRGDAAPAPLSEEATQHSGATGGQNTQSTKSSADTSSTDMRTGVDQQKVVDAADSAVTAAADAPVDSETRAAVMRWLDQMGSDATIERRAASDGLDAIGEAGISTVVMGLRSGTPLQKRGAATFLVGRVSPRDEAAATALIDSLSATDAALRHAALQAVEKLAREQLVLALPALLALAENQGEAEAYRSRAVRAISKLGSDGASATDKLVRLAQSSASGNVRRASYVAIAKVAPTETAEAFFQTQLQTGDSADLRRLAAKWLAGVAVSNTSLEQLVNALNDEDEAVRLEAVDALVALGKPALPLLVKALASPDVTIRRYAVLAIGKLGLMATDAASALEACQQDPDKQVRDLAKAALRSLK